jgi:hypothetical protein
VDFSDGMVLIESMFVVLSRTSKSYDGMVAQCNSVYSADVDMYLEPALGLLLVFMRE